MIGALMRMPWEAVVRRMLKALHENGFDDIEAPQLSVLLWPGPDGMRPSDLAARMHVTKLALNYLLGDLERLGYLERRPDPDDRRARRITLTDRGRSLVPVVRGAVAQTKREWAGELGPVGVTGRSAVRLRSSTSATSGCGRAPLRAAATVHLVATAPARTGRRVRVTARTWARRSRVLQPRSRSQRCGPGRGTRFRGSGEPSRG
jgi:DNA-binding MarR family transcriptional regulator